jgi:hypothetical protein
MRSPLSAFILLGLATSMVACVVEDDGPHHYRSDPDSNAIVSPTPSTSASSGNPAAPAATTDNTSAMLVEVDSNQTMAAQPGEGVGVFVEYAKGGHWHVWWTCDTNKTSQSCDFAVSISAATGNLSNIDATEMAGGLYSSPNPSRIDASSTITTELRGIRFDTDAGGVITVQASLGTLTDGSFLFFVQDGKVNGGFTGKLTNPLRFQGNSP